jgi:hypothetical protein
MKSRWIVLTFSMALFAQELFAQKTYQLKATPKTIAWA